MPGTQEGLSKHLLNEYGINTYETTLGTDSSFQFRFHGVGSGNRVYLGANAPVYVGEEIHT